MRNLYLIRHGQASYGTEDYDRLSALGARQSQLLGEWFQRCGIEVHQVVAGALKRHVQTAEAFFTGYSGAEQAKDWSARIHRDPNFNEVDQVDMLNPTHADRPGPLKNGTAHMTFDEFRAQLTPAYYRWASGKFDHEYRQPFAHFNDCCKSAVACAVERAGPQQTVVGFTSGGTIAMILRQVLPLGDEATSSLMWVIKNTSVTHLAWDGKRFDLRLFNSTAHLDHHGDASLVTLT